MSIRRIPNRGARALAAGLSAGLLLAGCAGAPPELSNAAAPIRAEQWSTAYRSALRQGMFNLRRFYDGGAELDLTALGRGRASELDEDLRLLGETFDVHDADAAHDAVGEVYLSTTGALEQSSFMDQAFQAPHQLVSIEQMSATGIASQTYAVSELAWRSARADDPRILAAHKLALTWAAAWGGATGGAIAALYEPDATLSDELVGVEAASRAQIASLAGDRASAVALPNLAITTMPDLGGPAVFVVGGTEWTFETPMTQVVVMGSANDGAACPGGVAAVLDLDPAGRITHEQRFHRAADLTRCGTAGPAPSGWWDTLAIPAPVAVEATGMLDLGGNTVAMFNSTPGLDGLVSWAYRRFGQAKLDPPKVSQMTYLNPSVDVCRGGAGGAGQAVSGLALGDQLSLCFTPAMVCADAKCREYRLAAKGVTLHELGHAWMSTHTDRKTGEAFTHQAGLARWASADVPWQQRGVELAASVLAWGLDDEDYPVDRKFRIASCEQLASLFHTLTGVDAPAAKRCGSSPSDEASR